MAKFTPLGGLLKKYGIEEEEDNSNIYDDGSVWSLPETPSSSYTYESPLKNLVGSNYVESGVLNASKSFKNEQIVDDPLKSARNQMQYYTNKLNDLGVEEEKPSVLSKAGSFAVNLLNRVSAIPSAIENTLSGTVNELMKQSNDSISKVTNDKRYKEIEELGFVVNPTNIRQVVSKENEDKVLSASFSRTEEDEDKKKKAKEILDSINKDYQEGIGDTIKNIGNALGAGLKSGASTASGLFTGEYSDKNVDWGRTLENSRNSNDKSAMKVVELLEKPGYKIAKSFGADDESATNIGNLVADLGLSFGIGSKLDIDGAGKALKTLNKADKLNEINKIANIDDALKLAKKYNNYDDFVSELGEKASKYNAEELNKMYQNSVQTYAEDLIKDVNKGLGGVNSFKGLEVGNQVVLTPEQLSKISKNKVQSALLKTGLSLYSPVGALVNNKLVDKIADSYNKTKIGSAINNTIYKGFGGGANNEWLKAMKDNPEKALEYANERKQLKLTKKAGEERIQKAMETINKYSDMKETPEELTKIIENPVTREARQIKVEREMLSPEYITKMMNLGKNEREKLVSSLNTQKSNLNKQLTELKSLGKDAKNKQELVKGIEQEIKNLENRITKVNEVASSKSIDLNKHMQKFGYKSDYSDMFDKALTTDIETLTEQLGGDRDLAEALQESANRVMDNLDKKYEGLSDYFVSYSKLKGNDSKNSSKFLGEEMLEDAKKANISVDLDEYRTNKQYKDKVDGMIKYRNELNDASSKRLSKENEVFKNEGYEGSGDVITDLKDIARKRATGETPVLGLGETHSKIKQELEELKNPSKLQLEKETKSQKKFREDRIKELEKELNKSSISDIKDGRKVNETTGELYYEGNKATGEKLDELVNKIYKDDINKVDSLELRSKIKSYETEGLGYIEKKSDALKASKEIVDYLGIDKDVNEIAEKLMYDGVEYLKELKDEVKASYFEDLTRLTDDEIEILERELTRKSNWKIKSENKKTPKYVEEKELQKALDLDVEGDISVTGKDRTKWLEEEESKRAVTRTKYDGIEYDRLDNLTTKEAENLDKYKQIMKDREEFLAKQAEKEQLNKPKFTQAQIEELEAKYSKEYEKFKNKTALDSLVKKVKQTEQSSPFAKEIEKGLPENLKGIKALKFSTEQGEILIDSDINSTDLKKILKNTDYDSNKVGTRIVYTNKELGNGAIGKYYYNNDTVYINIKNLTKKQVNTVLEHEVGHKVMNKIIKANPDLTEEMVTIPFLKYYRNLDDKAKEKFISAVTKANSSNVPDMKMMDLGMVTQYLNKITKQGADLTTISKEGFAELYSLFNNNNKTVQKLMKQVDSNAYNNFIEIMSKYTPEETIEVSKVIRKRFGDDYANKILELKNKKSALSNMSETISKTLKKANDIKDTNVTIKAIEDDIKHLEHLMDNTSYDEAGNIVSRDYEEFFNTLKEKNPTKVKEIEEQVPKYKKLFDMEEKIFEIDNTKDLSEEAKSFMEEYKAIMKDIAIREGIYDKDDAEKFTTYVMHMINPKYSDEAEIIEKGRKLKQELSDPLNVHALSRKKKGTIEELNKASYNQDGIKIFEENINRILLKRQIESEKFVFKKQQLERVLDNFAVPVITNFDKEVNKFEHMFDRVGEELINSTGLTKAEIKKLYNDKYNNSMQFVKEKLFENFKEQYKDLTPSKYSELAEEFNIPDNYKYKIEQALKKNQNDKAIELLFEGKNFELNKYSYAESFMSKYGYGAKINDPMQNIPKYTDDGREYVYNPKRDVDKTKQMPYDIEGGTPYTTVDAIGSYNEFIYKTAKDRNMIIVELPNENPEKVVKRTISDTAMEEAISDRTNLAERINMLLKGDKDAIEGFDALAGYNIIDPKKMKYEEVMVDSGSKKYLIDRNAWENYQKAIKDAEYKEKNALLKIYDGLSNIFKSQAIFSVAFHERNAIQNVISSYVKTGANLLDPKLNMEAIKIQIAKDGDEILSKAYGGYNVDEILLQCKKSGLFENQIANEFAKDTTSKFLKGEVDKLTPKKTTLGQKLNPFSTDFIGYQKSRQLAETIENQAKIVNVLTHLENGFNLSDAIDLTKETLFDYSDITQFESNVMRRIVPFYTFMRKNIPSQIDNLMNHNARMARIQSIYAKSSQRFESDKDRALRPDYLDGQLAIGNNKYLNLGDATQDLNKLTNPKEALSGLNPIIKTPLELLFNKKLYSDSEMSKYDKASEKAQYMLESNVPLTRQVSALHKLLTGTEDEKKSAGNTLKKTFLGSLQNEFDTEKQEKATMYDYISQLQNQYYEYVEKHPEKLKELEEKALQEKNKNNGYVSPLKKLIKK